MYKWLVYTVIIGVLFSAGSLKANDVFEAFEAKVFKSSHGTLNYRMHIPEKMNANKKYPLVLLFHGAGERGDENRKQLSHGAKDILAYTQTSGNPAIIVVPQCPKDKQWVNTPWGLPSHTMPEEPSVPMKQTMELLNKTISDMPVDKSRVYVTGLSMGGFGTWDILQRQPDIFAAAMPICGGADTNLAATVKDIPIWVFHGGNDKVVKTKRDRDMVAALKKAGGSPKYTEYKGGGHNAWRRTYSDQEVLKWLLDQKKTD